MTRAWILQANPKAYDVDQALQNLDYIWWRVPQRTADLAAEDVVLIWRSGADAGIVGVGRIAAEPRAHTPGPNESQFVRDPSEGTDEQTRTLVRVRATPFVAKHKVRSLPRMAHHQIIQAPMGTVFAVETDQWDELRTLVDEPPNLEHASPTTELPPSFSWQQRTKSVQSMPGGYGSYLDSLNRILDSVEEQRPTSVELPALIQRTLDTSENRSEFMAAFLRRSGFLSSVGDSIALSEWSERWRKSGDPRIPVALLHSRVRFIGEMLAVTTSPATPSDVLNIAKDRFSTGWDTLAQISRRRGWLESAGMLQLDESGRLQTTEAGSMLLQQLALYEPEQKVGEEPAPATASLPGSMELDGEPVSPVDGSSDPFTTEALVAELVGSCTASTDPDRFERAVRAAFAFLGFEAQWLGGAGKTDILLDAPLGMNLGYRVIVDCKTSAAGSVSDQQVDWITFQDHKKKHEADFVALVAPSPNGRRLFERAAATEVTVFSVDQLIALCRQHVEAPLGLSAYRRLFLTFGSADLEAVSEVAEDWLRLTALTRALLDAIRARSAQFGALSARDLIMVLADEPVADGVSESEVQSILDTLSSPLVGILEGLPDDRFAMTVPDSVVSTRLIELGRRLGNRNPARP